MDLKTVKNFDNRQWLKHLELTTVYDTKLIKEQIDWLIKQAEIVNKIKDFCEYEADNYAEMKMDESRSKVNRIFFNGKQRAFENVVAHIKNLEEN